MTLPLRAVDIGAGRVLAHPELGVRTKNSKATTCYLIDVPELTKVVAEWDMLVRSSLNEFALWFARMDPDTGELDDTGSVPGRYRTDRFRKDLGEWISRVGLRYYSPHKFRHGHAVYCLKRSRDVADLKAVSQNLMHESLKTTDSIYSILSPLDVQQRIVGLGSNLDANDEGIIEKLEQVLKLLKGNSAETKKP